MTSSPGIVAMTAKTRNAALKMPVSNSVETSDISTIVT